MGTYTGNGLSGGQFIDCGFNVDFVIVKALDTFGGYWFIFNRAYKADGRTWTAIDQANPYTEQNTMYGLEGTGFRVYPGGGEFGLYDNLNSSGESYLCMAFSSVTPTVYLDAVVDIAAAVHQPVITAL